MLYITAEQLFKSNRSELEQHKYQLVQDQLKLDEFFNHFLEENTLKDNDLNTPEWITYREMMKEYDRIDTAVRTADHYLGKHSRRPRLQNSK
tara:strand:- start:187 stop:462 length:276 start_codon:yes stop_codon:yes gene_type:complete